MLLSNMTKLDSAARDLIHLRVPFRIADDEPAPPAAAAAATGEPAADAPASSDAPAKQSVQASEFELPALDLLLEVFLKGDDKKYNPNATYDFLASVFANVSLVRSHAPRVARTGHSHLMRPFHSSPQAGPSFSLRRTGPSSPRSSS